MSDAKRKALMTIHDIAFNAMEACDQPYFSAFSRIVDICANPEWAHEQDMGQLDVANLKTDIAAKDAEIDEWKRKATFVDEAAGRFSARNAAIIIPQLKEKNERLKHGWMAAECKLSQLYSSEFATCATECDGCTRQGTDYCSTVRDIVEGGE